MIRGTGKCQQPAGHELGDIMQATAKGFAAGIEAAADCIHKGRLSFHTFDEAEQAIRALRPTETAESEK